MIQEKLLRHVNALLKR